MAELRYRRWPWTSSRWSPDPLVHGDRVWCAAAGVALAVQLLVVDAQFLGWPMPSRALTAVEIDAALSIAHNDDGPAAILAAIVGRTCAAGRFSGDNVFGADLLRLNGHSASYTAAKERLAGRAGDCRYDSMGFQRVPTVQRVLAAEDFVYWIALDPRVHPVPPVHEFLNHSAPVVFRQLRRRGVLQPEPWNGPPGVRLFRFTKR